MAAWGHLHAPDLPLRALLWDVDGTLAETERDGHRLAFNRAFADAGLAIAWDAASYARWLAISGGRERIAAQLQALEGVPPQRSRVDALQRAKQHHYQSLMAAGQLQLRPGVAALLQQAHRAGIAQAIVTTSGRVAVEALGQHLLGPLADVFSFWVCGDDVARKKPDPQAYLQAAQRLLDQGQIHASDEVLVIEDTPQGLEAAHGAGLACLLTLSHYSRLELTQAGALNQRLPAVAVVNQLGPDLEVLQGPPCQNPASTLSYLQALVP